MIQTEFLPQQKGFYKGFGGTLLKQSHAKTKRPLSTKNPMHLVMRSSKAKAAKSFRHGKNHQKVNKLLQQVSRKHGVRLYQYANVGNHLHLLIKLSKTFQWRPFIRELSGKLAMLIDGHDKRETPFFDQRPFSRVVNGWKRAYSIAKDYVELNQMEAAGIISRKVKVREVQKLSSD